MTSCRLERRALTLALAAVALAGCGDDRTAGVADGCVDPCDGSTQPTGDAPTVFLTVNEIPAWMNGSLPFTALDGEPRDFLLALPPSGFTLDVTVDAGDDPVDWSTLSVTCDAALGDGSIAAGEPLGNRFGVGADPGLRSWRIESSTAFPPTPPGEPVACTATVRDEAGRRADPSALAFAIVPGTAELLPFDDPDAWVLDFSRDLFAITAGFDPTSSAFTIFSALGGNGTPDYLEEMRAVGFQGSESAPGAASLESSALGEVGVNAIVARRLRRAVLSRVRGFYHQGPDGLRDDGSVPIDFLLDDDPGAPDLDAFSRDGDFSIMGMGGEGRPEDRDSFFGRAELDPRNEERNDNSIYGLGVFTTTAIRRLLEHPLAAAALAPWVTQLGGTPIGDDPSDPMFLADDFDPDAPGVDPEVLERHERFTFLFDQVVKAWGALTAHEIGHSLGLVADGPPPTGLFGGEANAEFADPLTTPAHLDVEGLNIMAAGGGGAGLDAGINAANEEPFFTALELAYLRSRLWVLP